MLVWRRGRVGTRFFTLCGLALSDHEGTQKVPGSQQLPLCIFPADALEEPSVEEQKAGPFIHFPLNFPSSSEGWECFGVNSEKEKVPHSSASRVSLAT